MAKLIYNSLLRHNVKDVFMYSGGAIMPLVDCFYNQKIKYYINSNENCLGYAATGYAKSLGSKTPSVSIVTSGPGLTNMITAMTDSQHDSTPMIVISGQVSTKVLNTGAFQECPAVELTKPVTKWSVQPKNTEDLPYVIDKAFHISTEGKPGVVHIDLCKDVISDNRIDKDDEILLSKIKDQFPIRKIASTTDLPNIVDTINRSNRPIIILGKGATLFSKQIRKFVRKFKIPVTSTIHGMGIFPETDPLCLPFLGMHGSPASNYSIQESDCVINLGSRFDDRIIGKPGTFAPKAKLIYCNIEECNTLSPHYSYNGCISDFLTYLDKTLNPYIKRYTWNRLIDVRKETYPFIIKNTGQLKSQDIVKALDTLIDHTNTIITTGVGNHQMYAAQFLSYTQPNSFLSSGSLGVMGVGLPYAIGAQIANPSKMVIDIDGDGSFNQTFTDLKMLTEHKLPVKIIVLDDGCLSMVKVWEDLFYKGRNVATTLNNNPDYTNLAKAFGIKSLFCSTHDNVIPTLKEALEYNGPVLCHFKTVTDKCLPLVKPGSALNEMILE